MIKNFVFGLFMLIATPAIGQSRHCPNNQRNERALQEFKRHSGYPYGRPGYVAVNTRSDCNCRVVRRNDFVWVREFEASRIFRNRPRQCRLAIGSDNDGSWHGPRNSGKKHKNDKQSGDQDR